MSGKLFTHGPPCAASADALVLIALALAVAGVGGCKGAGSRVLTPPAAVVDGAVRPDRFAPALLKLGAAHYRSVARFEAGPDGSPMEAVTTETDVWLDDRRNWRLVELNDKDGGREIVLHGRDLSVALRYGKMIRRAAEDPEPQHLLEEGIGAPFAGWELLRTVSTVDDFGNENRAGRKVHLYKLTKAPTIADNAGATVDSDRRAWRRTIVADVVDGTFVVDELTGLPLQVDLRARYSMRRPVPRVGSSAGGGGASPEQSQSDVGVPMHGAIEVHTTIEDIGRSPAIARPEAEDLPVRQRTVPEEKGLLGGLPRSPPPPPTVPAKVTGGRRTIKAAPTRAPR